MFDPHRAYTYVVAPGVSVIVSVLFVLHVMIKLTLDLVHSFRPVRAWSPAKAVSVSSKGYKRRVRNR